MQVVAPQRLPRLTSMIGQTDRFDPTSGWEHSECAGYSDQRQGPLNPR